MELTAFSVQEHLPGSAQRSSRINPSLLVFISRLILLVESLNTLSIIFSATSRLILLKTLEAITEIRRLTLM